jgi:hypothetical protein
MYLPPGVKELSGFAAQGKPGAEDIRASWDDWMVCGQVDGLPTPSALARFACGAAPIPFAPYPPSLYLPRSEFSDRGTFKQQQTSAARNPRRAWIKAVGTSRSRQCRPNFHNTSACIFRSWDYSMIHRSRPSNYYRCLGGGERTTHPNQSSR